MATLMVSAHLYRGKEEGERVWVWDTSVAGMPDDLVEKYGDVLVVWLNELGGDYINRVLKLVGWP